MKSSFFMERFRFMTKKLSSATLMIFIYLGVQFLPVPIIYLFPRDQYIPMSLTLSLIFALIGSILMLWVNHRRVWTPATELTEQPSAPIGKVLLWGVVGFVVSIIVLLQFKPESIGHHFRHKYTLIF